MSLAGGGGKGSLVMPDLTLRTRLFRHDVYSATATLAWLGITLDQVVLEYAGGGWRPGTLVRQSPAAGSPITPTTRIVLAIAGTGTLESMPYALREESSRETMAADQLCGLLDMAIARARTFVHEGASHFRLNPSTPISALRWIEDVMRSSAAPWSQQEWYRVARLFSALPRVAGRQDAIAVALGFVFSLKVERVEVMHGLHPLDPVLSSRLGERNGRLGIDTVVGNGIIAPYRLKVTIGPVSLETYLEHVNKGASRRALCRLLTPAFLPGGIVERWVVQRRSEGYRLAAPDAPAMLGVSSYLMEAAP